MKDIFEQEVNDYDIVCFPFVKQGPYMNSRKEVWLSYGVVKGNRVYLLDNLGKLIYKSPNGVVLVNIANLPNDATDNVLKIREMIDEKQSKKNT